MRSRKYPASDIVNLNMDKISKVSMLKLSKSLKDRQGEVKEVSSLALEEQGGRQQSSDIVNLDGDNDRFN